MKKLFSVLLAVALMASMVMSASAATNLLSGANIYANDTNFATLTDNGDGTYTVVTTKGWDSATDAAYGMAIETQMTGVDLTATPYVNLKLKSDVPFRFTLLDKNAAGEAKWIGFGNEFFNTVFPSGTEAPSTAPENAFFPAGEYDCAAFLKGYYDWKTNNDKLTGYDPANANVTAFYLETLEPGTVTVSGLTLAAGEDDNSSDNGGSNNNSSNNNNSSTNDNPKTGDTEVFALTIVALAAAAVVALSVVSKKAKSR
ncbi:MAG: LPXTG cell wall anchor domain-containing protein [Clostridia bacterium]|nr:LPXTG cell wall anchor domain-containing protein [Clostridia bacterium]